ncbi:MAG: DUF2442 domain-containing protein [Salinivirgaceae bacterium]|jgi:hypothetical protein
MNSNRHGIDTLTNNEVTNISKKGIWVLISNKEYFIPFSSYPIFQKATIEQILNFKMLSPNQLHWDQLDCDIELTALENPQQFPLYYH